MRAFGLATAVGVSGCSFTGLAGESGNAALGSDTGAGTASIGDDPGSTTADGPDPESTGGAQSDGTTGDDGPGGESSSTSVGGGESTGEPAVCSDSTWWNVEWSRRRELHINNADIDDDLADFPVLLRLTSQRVEYALTQDSGADIRIVDPSDGSVLAHEIEAWDETGDSFVWVRLPLIPADGSPTPVFHLYYGNPNAGDASLPPAVWTANYRSVHHMTTLLDSTGTGHNGIGPNLPADDDGLIGGAKSFDGIDDYVVLPNEGNFDFDDDMTVEVVFRVESFTLDFQALVTKGDNAWRVQRDFNNSEIAFSNDDDFGSHTLDGNTNVADGGWHTIAATYDGSNKRLFVDGQQDASTLYIWGIDASNDAVAIGENLGATGRVFHGTIDEVRISPVARSAEWLSTTHRAMLDLGVVLYGAADACP